MKIGVYELTEKMKVVRLEGQLNAHSALQLKDEIAALVDDGVIQIIVNLTQVEFVDSSGLAALVSGMRRTRVEGGNFKLVGVQPMVMQVFELTALDRVFEFHPDEEAAVASF